MCIVSVFRLCCAKGGIIMKKVKYFILISFLLTWALCSNLWLIGGYASPYKSIYILICMTLPALSAIIITLYNKKPLSSLLISPKFTGNKKYYLLAWLTPMVAIIVGGLAYFIVFPSEFDLSMSLYLKSMAYELGGNISNEEIKGIMVTRFICAITIELLISFISLMGEEIGWRGFLLKNLCEKYSYLKSTIITGIIWGLWHTPMILMGHHFGLEYIGYPFTGILAMTVFCIFSGSFLSLLTLKTNSCIPAAIAHGVINGAGSYVTIFLSNPNFNPLIGPTAMGILGIFGFVIIGTISLIKINKLEALT